MTDYFFLSEAGISCELPAYPLRHQRLPS
jgi:hypothetical protein